MIMTLHETWAAAKKQAWKEFKEAPSSSRKLIPGMFFFFLLGLGLIAIAPMFGSR